MSLILVLLTIIAVLIVIMLPRIYGDWLSFNHYCQQEEYEKLKNLLQAENQWVIRHIICAVAAIGMVVTIKMNPTLQEYEQLSNVIVIYAMFSLVFAFAESLFAHRISNVTFQEVEIAE